MKLLILTNLKRYFSHPENSILNLSLPYLQEGIVLIFVLSPFYNPYLLFISFLYLHLYVLGDDALIS